MKIKTREELHEYLLSLPPTAYGDSHCDCIIGQACKAVYERESYSFEESGYPLDVANVVAVCNDQLPQEERINLVPVLPHPNELPELTTRQNVALALWCAKKARPLYRGERAEAVDGAIAIVERRLTGEDIPDSQIRAAYAAYAATYAATDAAYDAAHAAADATDAAYAVVHAAHAVAAAVNAVNAVNAARAAYAAAAVHTGERIQVAIDWLNAYFEARSTMVRDYPA